MTLIAFIISLLVNLFPAPVKAEYHDDEFICRGKDAGIVYLYDSSIPKEGYAMDITSDAATVRYSDEGGLYYARRALSELTVHDAGGDMHIPCCSIYDYPRTSWRGFMLDSGRQYQSPETIMRLLDMMSSLKMNVFHWHLTEGLGWRLYVRRYPKLARIGAFVADGPGQKGYYSRRDIKRIVKYAAERNITVVPEVDMPGHAEAALRACPEFGCFGVPADIPQTGFTDVIFCAGKDRTIRFLKDVLDEVCELFPSQYIHLGGDEAPKGNWDRCPDCARRISEKGLKDTGELQQWFSAEMAGYLQAKGRKAIFWEDVLHGADLPLPGNVAIQWWNYRRHGDLALQKALEKGYELICSPNYYMYLNFPEEPGFGYGPSRTFSLEDAYLRNHVNEGLDSGSPLVLGGECALWTDYGLTEDMLGGRLFPRIYAIAQLLWSGNALPLSSLPSETAGLAAAQ